MTKSTPYLDLKMKAKMVSRVFFHHGCGNTGAFWVLSRPMLMIRRVELAPKGVL